MVSSAKWSDLLLSGNRSSQARAPNESKPRLWSTLRMLHALALSQHTLQPHGTTSNKGTGNTGTIMGTKRTDGTIPGGALMPYDAHNHGALFQSIEHAFDNILQNLTISSTAAPGLRNKLIGMETAVNMTSVNSTIFSFEGYHVFSSAEIVLWFVVYGLIAFLAVTGNLLVIYVVMSSQRLQNVPNYFIVNLALADTITGMIAVPFKFQAALLQRWTLPPFMCQLLTFTETLSLSVSVFTLTGSAVDRFVVVFFPGKWKMSPHFAGVTLSAIWAFSLAISLPFGAYHQTIGWVNDTMMENSSVLMQLEEHEIMWRCMPIYGTEQWWRVYNVYLTIIQYFVPLIIVDGAYILIAFRVWITEQPALTRSRADRQFQKDRRKVTKKLVVKLLVIVVTLFTFCWLPYETYLLLSETTPNINMYYYINVVFMLAHCLAMSNSCINPIIYGIYNKKFQREYRRVFYRCCYRAGAIQLTAEMQDFSKTDGHDGRHSPNGAAPNSTHHFITSELGR